MDKDKNEAINNRKQQAIDRRNQIIEIGLRNFAEKGYENTSIKDIAKASNISQGLMYHYFKSKNDLFLAVIDRYSFLDTINRLTEDAESKTVREFLYNLATNFCIILEENRDLARIIMREMLNDNIVYKYWIEFTGKGMNIICIFLEERMKKGEIKEHDSKITARMIFSSLLISYFQRVEMTDNEINKFINIILEGIEN